MTSLEVAVGRPGEAQACEQPVGEGVEPRGELLGERRRARRGVKHRRRRRERRGAAAETRGGVLVTFRGIRGLGLGDDRSAARRGRARARGERRARLRRASHLERL